jgi:hypothetical protein
VAAYNFQKRFVGPIRVGTKQHTIRADRKDGRVPKVGEGLWLYCGMRTKQCFKILDEAPPCTRVLPIFFSDKHGLVLYEPFSQRHILCPEVTIEGGILALDECESLAKSDGFRNFPEMMAFWVGRLPFKGKIIHWQIPEKH